MTDCFYWEANPFCPLLEKGSTKFCRKSEVGSLFPIKNALGNWRTKKCRTIRQTQDTTPHTPSQVKHGEKKNWVWTLKYANSTVCQSVWRPLCPIITCCRNIRSRVLNLFAISYHLGTPYCQRVPLFPEQLI